MSDLVTIRKIVIEDLEPLTKAANTDDHFVYMPTHVVTKGNDYVGFISVSAMPMILTWQDSKRVKTTDSLKLIGFVEGACSQIGAGVMCMPCSPKSPYLTYLPKWGYKKFGNCDMFAKAL